MQNPAGQRSLYKLHKFHQILKESHYNFKITEEILILSFYVVCTNEH